MKMCDSINLTYNSKLSAQGNTYLEPHYKVGHGALFCIHSYPLLNNNKNIQRNKGGGVALRDQDFDVNRFHSNLPCIYT